jgi:hypothetical protein
MIAIPDQWNRLMQQLKAETWVPTNERVYLRAERTK